jgi:hypothetical protein
MPMLVSRDSYFSPKFLHVALLHTASSSSSYMFDVNFHSRGVNALPPELLSLVFFSLRGTKYAGALVSVSLVSKYWKVRSVRTA